MPFEVLEKQIKALPKEYYNSLVDYLEFLTKKAQEEMYKIDKEENNLQKMREASLLSVWETVKNDTW